MSYHHQNFSVSSRSKICQAKAKARLAAGVHTEAIEVHPQGSTVARDAKAHTTAPGHPLGCPGYDENEDAFMLGIPKKHQKKIVFSILKISKIGRMTG